MFNHTTLHSCMNETLYSWTFKFHKVVRQQNSDAVEDFILSYSAVYLRIQKWKNYWNRSTFAKVIIKIKVAPFLWPTVYTHRWSIGSRISTAEQTAYCIICHKLWNDGNFHARPRNGLRVVYLNEAYKPRFDRMINGVLWHPCWGVFGLLKPHIQADKFSTTKM